MIGLELVFALLQGVQPAPVATISAAELARAPRLTISPEPRWRIGGAADGPYGFARIVGALFMRNGQVAVLESNPSEVRLYDPAGKHIKSFGRRGRGPGEFENLQRLALHVADSLVVIEIGRVSVFDAAGAHARTLSTINAGVGFAGALRVLSNGSLVARTSPLPTQRERKPGLQRDSIRLVLINAKGDSILRDLDKRVLNGSVVAHHDGVMTMTVAAFGAPYLADVGDSVLFLMQGDIPIIEMWSLRSGARVRTIAFSLTPRAVTARDRDEFIRSRRAAARTEIARQGAEAYLKIMPYPEHMPFFDALRLSFDGALRLRRYKAALDTGVQWLSLTSAGRLLAVIDLPQNVRVLDFDAERVLMAERDADDLEYVAVYRLVSKNP